MEATNSTSSNPINKLQVYYWEQVFTASIILTISMIGIAGNSLIILAVAFCQKLHTSTNAFVTSLSVADLLTSAHLIWYAVGVLGKDGWPIPNSMWLCKWTGFTIYACRGTSVYTLAAIAINRLMFITRPCMYNMIFSSWKLVTLIAIPWIIPRMLLIITTLAGVGEFGYDFGDLSCSAIGSGPPDIMAICIAVLGFPLPLLIVIFSYARIYLYLRAHFRAKKISLAVRIPSSHTAEDSSSNATPSSVPSPTGGAANSISNALDLQGIKDRQLQKSMTDLSAYNTTHTGTHTAKRRQISQEQIKITKNLFLIVCSVYVCFLPYFILLFLQHSHVHFYARIITFSNSAINFAIHASKHPDFNQVIRHMLRGSYSDIPRPSRLLRFLLSKWNTRNSDHL